MHDELLYEQAAVHTIRLSLENGSADITAVPDAEDVRILIDTDAEDAAALLYADVKDATLTIRQRTPFQQLLKARKRPSLHVTIETPATWKGALHAATASGHLHAEGLSGTDIVLRAAAGTLEAHRISGICVSLQSVRGSVAADDIECEKLRLSSIASGMQVQRCSTDRCRVLSLAGSVHLAADRHIEHIGCKSLTGCLTVETPLEAFDASLHGIRGKLRTQGVDLADGQPVIRMTTLSGRLTIIRCEGE